jgi:hypothetical protein
MNETGPNNLLGFRRQRNGIIIPNGNHKIWIAFVGVRVEKENREEGHVDEMIQRI